MAEARRKVREDGYSYRDPALGAQIEASFRAPETPQDPPAEEVSKGPEDSREIVEEAEE